MEGVLAPRDRQLLDFERAWDTHAGRKLQAISATFGISPARYYQLLARLIDDPRAESYDPLTVRRLRRRRAERERRTARLSLQGP